MTRFLTGAFVAVAVLGVAAAVGAQGQGRGGNRGNNPNPTPAVNPNPYDPTKTDTVVGCLRTGQMAGTFVVADATLTKGAPGAKPAGQSAGTSGTAKATYVLRGQIPPGVNLTRHVDKKVEVVGATAVEEKTQIINMYMFKEVAATCS